MCADPEVNPERYENGKSYDPFFPERGEMGHVIEAQLICFKCPVIKECGQWHEKFQDEYGVWAGNLYSPRGED